MVKIVVTAVRPIRQSTLMNNLSKWISNKTIIIESFVLHIREYNYNSEYDDDHTQL